MIETKLLPQSPQFAINILRFYEELDKLTKMLPEPNNTILMCVIRFYQLVLEKPRLDRGREGCGIQSSGVNAGAFEEEFTEHPSDEYFFHFGQEAIGVDACTPL